MRIKKKWALSPHNNWTLITFENEGNAWDDYFVLNGIYKPHLDRFENHILKLNLVVNGSSLENEGIELRSYIDITLFPPKVRKKCMAFKFKDGYDTGGMDVSIDIQSQESLVTLYRGITFEPNITKKEAQKAVFKLS